MWEGWPCFPYLETFLQTSNSVGQVPQSHAKKVSEPNKPFEDFHHMIYIIAKWPCM
jgi:hypothetical protein